MQILYTLVITAMLLLLSFTSSLRIEDRRAEHTMTNIEIPAPQNLQ